MRGFTPEKQEIFAHRIYYREVGYFIYFREQFERAVKYFDESCSKAPNDIRALIGRSCANGKACHYKAAMRDINKALKLDPNNYVCHALKALNMYLNLMFEDALILNLKFAPYRKKPRDFELGAMWCTEAIQNCIGTRVGHPLRDHYKIIRRLAWKMAYDLKKPYQPKSKYKKKVPEKKRKLSETHRRQSVSRKITFSKSATDILAVNLISIVEDRQRGSRVSIDFSTTSPQTFQPEEEDKFEIKDSLYSRKLDDFVVPKAKPFPFTPLQRRTTNLKNYMAEKYLGIMYLDKIFLENLEQNLGGVGPSKESYDKINHMVYDGYKELNYKQELLRARRPFYFIKFQEATSSGALKIRQEEELQRMRDIIRNEAHNILSKGISYLKKGESRQVEEMVQKLIKYCDSKSKRLFPDRDKFLSKAYELACLSHYSLKRLNEKQLPLDQEKRINVLFGLPISSEPSKDSVIKQYRTIQYVDKERQIQLYERKIKEATTIDEVAFFLYETARMYFESRQLDQARIYCKKCVTIAKETDNWRWAVNALILTARIYVQQRNKNEAKEELNNCIDIVAQYEDSTMLNYLYKCQEVVAKADFDTIRLSKLQEIREKHILEILPDDRLKGEAAYLFRQMAGMPQHRRLGLFPGVGFVAATNDEPKTKTKKEGRKGVSKKPVKRVLPESEGLAFLSLVEYHLD